MIRRDATGENGSLRSYPNRWFACLGILLKLAVAAVLLTWMIRSGRLNTGAVAAGFGEWPALLGVFAAFAVQTILLARRWGLLLESLDIRLPFPTVFSLTMIGLLFNIMIPGAVGGDVLKGYYLARARVRLASTTSSILMDRILAMLALLVLASLGCLLNLNLVLQRGPTRVLVLFITIATLSVAMIIVIATKLGTKISRWHLAPRFLCDILEELHRYGQDTTTVFAAFNLSLIGQLLSLVGYELAYRSVTEHWLAPGVLLLIVPLGLVTTALPISPAGIGVGQAAFFALFQLFLPGTAKPGTEAFTVFQVVMILFCLTGLAPYLSFRRTGVLPQTRRGEQDRKSNTRP